MEYLASSGRWFLAIVVGLILAAFGIVDIVLKAFNVDWVVPRWVWVASLLVSLTVSPFMVFHRARLRRDHYKSRLDELENAHPNIRVESHITQDWLLLKVTNLGPETAVFSARVVRITGVEMGEAGEFGYDLGWHLVPVRGPKVEKIYFSFGSYKTHYTLSALGWSVALRYNAEFSGTPRSLQGRLRGRSPETPRIAPRLSYHQAPHIHHLGGHSVTPGEYPGDYPHNTTGRMGQQGAGKIGHAGDWDAISPVRVAVVCGSGYYYASSAITRIHTYDD